MPATGCLEILSIIKKNEGAQNNVTLNFIQAAGHSDNEQNIALALKEATDHLITEV